jgi:NAD-dependent SIR2 family protein deacetylase
VVPDCPECGGVLKPRVVFFGESVPRARVEDAFAALDQVDALLVVGSSLMVYSGYRFVRAARERGRLSRLP